MGKVAKSCAFPQVDTEPGEQYLTPQMQVSLWRETEFLSQQRCQEILFLDDWLQYPDMLAAFWTLLFITSQAAR